MDKKYSIFKYRYICSECGKTIITQLNGIVDKNCCYTVDTKDLVVNLYSNEDVSYANATKFINGTYELNISRQTMYLYNYNKTYEYLSQKEEIIQKKLEEENIESTGYIGHDEAFFRIIVT